MEYYDYINFIIHAMVLTKGDYKILIKNIDKYNSNEEGFFQSLKEIL